MPSAKNKPPTPDEVAAAQQVTAAGAEAAVTAPPGQEQQAAAVAIRQEAERAGLDLSDEQIEQLAQKTAELTANLTIDKLEQRGAFEAPPEAVAPPPQPLAPPAPSQQPADGMAAAAGAEQPPKPPQKRTLAHRFMGIP